MTDRSAAAPAPPYAILHAAFDACPLPIAVSVEHRFVAVNPAMTRLFDYAREQMLGASTRLLYPSDEEFARAGAALRAACAGNEPVLIENTFVTRGGRQFDALFHARAVDPGDPSMGVVGIIEDVTDALRGEEALRAVAGAQARRDRNGPRVGEAADAATRRHHRGQE